METRDHILFTALTSFIEFGFDRISLNEVVKRSGLTKGAFYYYFSSKEQLIDEVIERFMYQYVDKCMGHLNLPDVPVKDKLEMLPDALINKKACIITNGDIDDGMRKSFLILLVSSLEISDKLRERFYKAQSEAIKSIADLLRESQKDGYLEFESQPDQMAQLLFSTYRGVMFDWVTGFIDNSEEALKERLDVIVQTLKRN